jgi:hypothetical protein
MPAARHLETIRRRWRNEANMLIMWLGQVNPVLEALNLRPWTPVGRCALVLDAPQPMSDSRLVCCD